MLAHELEPRSAMGSDSDEDQLAQAIALSLSDSGKKKKNPIEGFISQSTAKITFYPVG